MIPVMAVVFVARLAGTLAGFWRLFLVEKLGKITVVLEFPVLWSLIPFRRTKEGTSSVKLASKNVSGRGVDGLVREVGERGTRLH